MSSHSILSTIIFTYYSIQYVFGAPNIIFILTDDQDVALDSMQAMPKVKAEIQAKGITFNNAYTNTPVCCPSRTETVSGRTYHNAKQSSIDCQGVSAMYNVYTNPNSLFNKFHSNNYVTGGFGKVTNNMDFCSGSSFNLDSFDRLHVSCDYHNFWTDTNFNKYVGDSTGEEETPTLMNAEDVYQTAQLGNATVNFIKEQLKAQRDDNALPFIIWVAPYAPHQPADPAVWYQNSFSDLQLLKTPNYNPTDVSNYHIPVSDNPQISSQAEKYMLLLYQDRLRSLLSVDDMVGSIVDAVDEYNAWHNTYLVYTSDHGYHIGQYRLPCGKYQPYEETTRIPLYVRGPGIDSGVETSAMVQNIDFLPTFIDLAGISYGDDDYDGRSFKQIFENTDSYNTYNIDSNWRQTVMFEYKSDGTKAAFRNHDCVMWCPNFDNSPFGESCVNLPTEYTLDLADNNYRVLRIKNQSVNWFYGEFVNNAFENPIFYEFYDLDVDEWQLTNSYNERDLDYLTDQVLAELHELVQTYGKCCGSDSCSPIGNNRPGEPGVCSGATATSSSSSSGGGKTGKSKAFSDISNFGFEDISFVLSGATVIEEKHKNDPENEYKKEVLLILEEIKEQKQKIFDKVMVMLGKLNADQVKLLAKLSENELYWLVSHGLKTYNETNNNNNNNHKKGEASHGLLPSLILSENHARRTNYGEYINDNYYGSDYDDTNSQLMFVNNGHNQQGLYNAHVYSMNTIGYEPYGVGLIAIILLCCITPIRYLCGVVSGVIGSYIFKLGNNKLKKSNDNKHEYEQISDHDGVV